LPQRHDLDTCNRLTGFVEDQAGNGSGHGHSNHDIVRHLAGGEENGCGRVPWVFAAIGGRLVAVLGNVQFLAPSAQIAEGKRPLASVQATASCGWASSVESVTTAYC
jgi:hypothetical protein